MIGVVIAAHAELAEAMLATARNVTQFQGKAAAVGVVDGDTTASYEERLRTAVEEDREPGGVLVLTDMFGGTPSNLAISVMETAKIEVLAGVNLPMLVKLASIRGDLPLVDAVARASEAGRKYISVASQILDA